MFRPKTNSERPQYKIKKRSVYPPEWVIPITGGRTPQLNAALTAYAVALLEACDRVQDVFTPASWEAMLFVLRGHTIDPELAELPALLAGVCEREAGSSEVPAAAALRLAAVHLRRLGYLEALATYKILSSVLGTRVPAGEWHARRAFVERCRQRNA